MKKDGNQLRADPGRLKERFEGGEVAYGCYDERYQKQ